MARGGKRDGAGRPSGARSRHTRERERATAEAAKKIVAALGPRAFEGDAHALLVTVYKDPEQPIAVRIDAAGKALPYEKPRLAAIEVTGEGGGPVQVERIERVVIDPAATDDGDSGED